EFRRVLSRSFIQCFEHHKKDWNDKHPEYYPGQHASSCTKTDGVITNSRWSNGPHQWHQTCHKSQRRHQNRSQTKTSTFDSGIVDTHSFIALLDAELDNEDRSFCQQTYQHNQTHLDVDVIFQSGEPNGNKHPYETDRH